MKLDRGTRLEMMEERLRQPVTRLNVPEIVGYKRNGEPIWEVAGGAFGNDYRDTMYQPNIADFGSVAPGTTETTLFPVGVSAPAILPANFWKIGRTVKLTGYFKWTSGTAGNITLGASYGAANNPAAKVNSTARAAVASVGPFGVFAEAYFTARSLGTAGTLSIWGAGFFPLGLMLSTADQHAIFPTGGVTVVSTIDTTVGTNAPMIHGIRSAGTDGVVCTSLLVEALN